MTLEYPTKITDPIREVFSMTGNRIHSVCTLYRNAGHDIDTTEAAERVFITHRWLQFALRHGDSWQTHAQADMARIRDEPDLLAP